MSVFPQVSPARTQRVAMAGSFYSISKHSLRLPSQACRTRTALRSPPTEPQTTRLHLSPEPYTLSLCSTLTPCSPSPSLKPALASPKEASPSEPPSSPATVPSSAPDITAVSSTTTHPLTRRQTPSATPAASAPTETSSW